MHVVIASPSVLVSLFRPVVPSERNKEHSTIRLSAYLLWTQGDDVAKTNAIEIACGLSDAVQTMPFIVTALSLSIYL